MKKIACLPAAVCISSLVFLAVLSWPDVAVCGEPKKAIRAAGESGGEASPEEQRQTYLQKAREKVAGFEKKIEELEAKARRAGSKAKADAKKGLKELRKKGAAAREEIRRLEASGRKAWEKAKRKVEAAMEELEKTYERVRSDSESE